MIITLLFVIVWLIRLYTQPLYYDNKLIGSLLTLIVPIFVLGISITTLAHRLGESGEFTAEYLHKACRFPVFACQSFLAILFAVTAIALPSGHLLDQCKGLLSYATLGSTLAIIPSFLFIILTLIRCVNPKEAIKATTKLYATRLENILAKDIYHNIRQKHARTEQEGKTDKNEPPSEEEWNCHLAKTQNAFKKAMEARDLEQIQAWLNCILEPVYPVVDICKEFPAFQEQYNYDPTRFYKLVSVYEMALNQLLALDKRANLWFVERGTHLIIKTVQEEVRRLFKNENCYCLRPLCWVVVGLYAELLKSEYSKDLRRQRAYFGIFYAYPAGLFKELPANCTPETQSNFRQILHEGLTCWLLKAIKEKDDELVESLCKTGRELVFDDDSVDLKKDKALLQHLVLAGKLISDLLEDKAETVSAKNLEMLFQERYAKLRPNLGDLATLYNDSRPTIATDLYRFIEELGDAWERTHYDPLTGSGSYSGTRRYDGIVHLDTGFLYAAALILESNLRPDSIPIDITNTKARLSELQTNHAKLETNGASVMNTLFGWLDKWIDECFDKSNK